MEGFNVGDKLLCVEGFAELKCGDYYTVKTVYEGFANYTYEVEEVPEVYWAHYRFVSVEDWR